VKVAFLLSTLGGSPLQGGLERGLRSLGHSVEYFRDGMAKNFDVLVVFNQTAHTTSYAYPVFPTYDVPVAFVDSAEYGYFSRLPGIAHRYATAFAPGSMEHDTKSLHEQQRLRAFLTGRSFPYLLREHSKYVDYPAAYHPIDYPLYHESACAERPDRCAYFRRSNDFFLAWGASHPWRLAITTALRQSSPGSEIRVIGEDGWPRMDQPTYFRKMRESRASASFDGYGSSSFRMTEVLVRCLLLQGPLAIRMRKPLVDGETCIAFRLTTQGEECLGTDVGMRLREAMADPGWSYRIHEAGYDHCMTHYTEAATAQYLVDTINAHDWSKPTPLTVDEQRVVDWEPLPNFQGD
jgi:hypothetical protein